MMKVAKLVDGINLDQKDKEYDLAEIILKSDNYNTSNYLDLEVKVTCNDVVTGPRYVLCFGLTCLERTTLVPPISHLYLGLRLRLSYLDIYK